MTVESPHNGVFVLGLPDVCAVDVYYDLWTNVGNVGRTVYDVARELLAKTR